jgi:hypothetical protein
MPYTYAMALLKAPVTLQLELPYYAVYDVFKATMDKTKESKVPLLFFLSEDEFDLPFRGFVAWFNTYLKTTQGNENIRVTYQEALQVFRDVYNSE